MPPQRRRPDLDRAREALREHDERVAEDEAAEAAAADSEDASADEEEDDED
jgi:hypothetical protein